VYESLILLDPDVDITPEQLATELRRFYGGKDWAPEELTVRGQSLLLRWPGYLFEVARESVPHVLDESAEIAAKYGAAHPDRARIARCTKRFCTQADDDPDMEHFNDYLFVGEALARLGKVYRFDQSSCEFM